MTKNDITTKIDNFEQRKAKYAPIFDLLEEIYGHLEWRQSQSPMDELVSCILSQNTNDRNRDKAFDALKAQYASWQDVVDAPEDEIVDTVRPAGLANQKGPRIQNVLRYLKDEYGEYNIDFLADMPIEDAKKWLVSLEGVGPKTAAIVLCFGFNLPAFPVDTHVHRVGKRIGFLPEKISADHAHPVMEAIVPAEDYYAFHIYLIRHGRDTCNARQPHCERCPLTAHCNYYNTVVKPTTKNNG
jgi:endonuclease-3